MLIIGGSREYYGAPILSALGSLKSGSDLTYILVPSCNFEVSRSLYPDFIVRSYEGDFFHTGAIDVALELAHTCDAVLIGPGMGEEYETSRALDALIPQLAIPTILDSIAIMSLKRIANFPLNQDVLITPHLNEFQGLIDKEFIERDPQRLMEKKTRFAQNIALDLQIHILLKGAQDLIVSPKGAAILNTTGNAGMTVGGSGDVLAGFVTSLIARKTPMFEAAQLAAYIFGVTGDRLAKRQGFAFSARDLAENLPFVLADMVKFKDEE